VNKTIQQRNSERRRDGNAFETDRMMSASACTFVLSLGPKPSSLVFQRTCTTVLSRHAIWSVMIMKMSTDNTTSLLADIICLPTPSTFHISQIWKFVIRLLFQDQAFIICYPDSTNSLYIIQRKALLIDTALWLFVCRISDFKEHTKSYVFVIVSAT
jgi:hypothetical protein